MDKFGQLIEPGTIRFERLLPGPVERVWAYLTESEKRGQWLASGEMELRIGGRVELIFSHKNLSPQDDPIPEKYKEHEGGSTMHGKITRIEPPRLLSYTWGEASGEESEVTFELTHRRLGDDRDILISVAGGWHTHLGILEDRLNGREPKGFWSVHMQMEEEYEKRV